AIAQHDLKRGELGVGAQHIEPVKARVFGDPRLVDGEMLGRDGLEIAAETAVADERLVALGELGAQPVEDGTALLGIAPRLGEIATDDVPSVADFDLLGLELGEFARNPRHDQRDKGRLIINHGAAHFGTAALAHAEDVFELAFLQRGNALGADHAAVGDDADAADAKTSARRRPATGGWALSRQRGRAGVADRIASWHGPSLISPTSLPAADHPARDLALSPVHPELPGRGGAPRRARDRCLL